MGGERGDLGGLVISIRFWGTYTIITTGSPQNSTRNDNCPDIGKTAASLLWVPLDLLLDCRLARPGQRRRGLGAEDLVLGVCRVLFFGEFAEFFFVFGVCRVLGSRVLGWVWGLRSRVRADCPRLRYYSLGFLLGVY